MILGEKASISPPARYGRYEIVRKLATGGMGEVFLAKAIGAAGFEKHVVIKKILPHLVEHPQFVEGLVREAKLLVDLEHPNIVQVIDLGVEGEDYFMAMEYVHGYNLAVIAHYCSQRDLVIPTAACAFVAIEVLAGLGYAHGRSEIEENRQNIIHRDVSPQNVLISREGRVKLTDFGIAKVLRQAEGEVTGTLKGKFRYMAPEVVEGGRIDHRYDLFATGVILFEALCRRHLFAGRTDTDILRQVREVKVPPITRFHPDVPASLVAVTHKALDKDPDRRYQTAAEFASALKEAIKPTTTDEAAAVLRRFVNELFDRPDFPINKPKIPDLKGGSADETTRSVLLMSRLDISRKTPDGQRRPLGKVAIGAVSLGIILVGIIVAYLANILVNRPGPSSNSKTQVIIVSGRVDVGVGSAFAELDAGVQTSPLTDTASVAPVDSSWTKVIAPKPLPKFSPDMGKKSFSKYGVQVTRCFREIEKSDVDVVRLKVISTIMGNGRVANVTIEPASEQNTPLGKCIIRIARDIRYPQHREQEVTFAQPLQVKLR
ncbi:MAG: protein kinase [Pseudomonadota bacterium]